MTIEEKEIYLQRLFEIAEQYHDKKILAESIDEFAYDPGNTENLQYYDGVYDEEKCELTIKTEVKGLRYENRSVHLEDLKIGDSVIIKRDFKNQYNSNNFEIFDMNSRTLGVLPAELCNKIAPLYDAKYINIVTATAHYIEQFEERSRYSKQGVLFVTLTMKFDNNS